MVYSSRGWRSGNENIPTYIAMRNPVRDSNRGASRPIAQSGTCLQPLNPQTNSCNVAGAQYQSRFPSMGAGRGVWNNPPIYSSSWPGNTGGDWRNAVGGCNAASISSVASSAASSGSSWRSGGVIKRTKQHAGVKNANRRETEDQKRPNPAGGADYKNAQLIWAKLGNQPNGSFNPLGDFSTASVEMARLGKHAPPFPLSPKDMTSRKAKSSIRPRNRMSRRLGDTHEEAPMGEALLAYQRQAARGGNHAQLNTFV